MDFHGQVESIRLAVGERASELGFSSGDEVVLELQAEVNLDVCVSRDEPNLERALKVAFERYRQRLSVEAIFELAAREPDSNSVLCRVLLKKAFSFAPVVPKSSRERCDSVARNAESSVAGQPRVEAAPICAVLVSSGSTSTAEREATGDSQSKRDRDANANSTQRSGRGKKSKQTADPEPDTKKSAAREEHSPDSTTIDTLLDILKITQSRTLQANSSARSKQKSGRPSVPTPVRGVIGCSLLLEMYKRGAVGLSFKLKSGAHEHSQLRVSMCVVVPIQFVEQPPQTGDASVLQPNAADESVYGAYPFDRSGTSTDTAAGDRPQDSEQQPDDECDAVARDDISVAELYDCLREATIRQLVLAQDFAIRFSHLSGGADNDDSPFFELCDPTAFIFRVPQSKDAFSYINVIYPADVKKDSEAPFRTLRGELHAALGVSTDRPAFHRAQAAFPSRSDSIKVSEDGLVSIPVGNTVGTGSTQRRTCSLLPTVHLNLLAGEPQLKAGIKRGYVRGEYAYFHYVCDGFDDSNWGCAYRSLQTLFSWYVMNGWTRISVPTLMDIQRALVACGDQEASLVGSRRWIGSTEVGLALQTLLAADGLDITYKILFVARGSELASHVRALLAHFDTVGTPIMVGGGQYAHTIIGAEFDEQEGRTRYLILDPHYVGPETQATVFKKGWCAWRDPATFFNDTTFYNLCMPQLPSSL